MWPLRAAQGCWDGCWVPTECCAVTGTCKCSSESTFGDWLYVLALGILAYEITGSATVVAVLTFAWLLPYVLFGENDGVLAARLRDQRLAALSRRLPRKTTTSSTMMPTVANCSRPSGPWPPTTSAATKASASAA